MKHRKLQVADAGQKSRPGIRIRRGIFAVLAVTVALSSCGGDDSEESDTSSSSSSTAVTADLEAMLLTATDIEAALGGTDVWNLETIDYAEGLSGGGQLPCENTGINPMIAERLAADIGVDGGRDDGNASLVELLISGDAEILGADIEDYLVGLEACATPAPFEEFSIPEMGDQQWAGVGACPGWAADSRGYFAVVRVGSNAVQLGVCEQPVTTGEELQITNEAFTQLLQDAVDKIKM